MAFTLWSIHRKQFSTGLREIAVGRRARARECIASACNSGCNVQKKAAELRCDFIYALTRDTRHQITVFGTHSPGDARPRLRAWIAPLALDAAPTLRSQVESSLSQWSETIGASVASMYGTYLPPNSAGHFAFGLMPWLDVDTVPLGVPFSSSRFLTIGSIPLRWMVPNRCPGSSVLVLL